MGKKASCIFPSGPFFASASIERFTCLTGRAVFAPIAPAVAPPAPIEGIAAGIGAPLALPPLPPVLISATAKAATEKMSAVPASIAIRIVLSSKELARSSSSFSSSASP